MRAIDADALKDYLRKQPRWIVFKKDDLWQNEGFSYDDVFFAIDNQPTIGTETVVSNGEE